MRRPAFLTTLFLLSLAPAFSIRAQNQPQPHAGQFDPTPIACGAGQAAFDSHIDNARPPTPAIPPGKALIYVFETMPNVSPLTKKVAIGVDGQWIGITQAQTYVTFLLDPGVHHICAHYEGRTMVLGKQNPSVLHHLDVKAGHTYYLYYRSLSQGSDGLVSFFDLIDEDEGQLLLYDFRHATSTPKK